MILTAETQIMKCFKCDKIINLKETTKCECGYELGKYNEENNNCHDNLTG